MVLRTKDWTLEVSGKNADEVESVAKGLASSLGKEPTLTARSPWISGSFYLAVLVTVVTLLLVAARLVSVWVLPLVVIGGLLAVSLIGALQMRQDRSLSEKSFLTLMEMTLKRLPLLRKQTRASDQRPQK